MSFLAPWFLAGVAAVGLPILFHLIRRTIREKQVFSTLMFLQPSPPRITRRSRLENLLLLLLRCLLLACLALAFARPFLQKPMAADPSSTEPRQIAILLDTSASMQREDLWQQAVQKAESLVNQAEASDWLALYTFDRQLRPVVSFEQAKSLPAAERRTAVRTALASLKPGWGAGHLGSALIGLSETFESSGNQTSGGKARKQIYLISDLAEGSHLEGLQGHEWPKDLTVSPMAVRAKLSTNAGLHLMPHREDGTSEDQDKIRVRVSNAADSKKEQFKLSFRAGTNQPPSPVEVYVPPGQSRVLSLSLTNGMSEVTMDGDDAPFDNTIRWVPELAQRIPILYLGEDVETDPNQSAYYLLKAFSPTRTREYDFQLRPPSTPFKPAELKDLSLLFVTSGFSVERGTELRAAVEAGRALVLVPSRAEALQEALDRLGIGGVKVEEAGGRNFALLAQIDFQHPLLAPFADARFSDFTKIHFWKHRRITSSSLPANARVLASFDDESPAWVEIPVGKGTVLLLTSGWAPADSQMALSTKFVPLLYSILERSRQSEDVTAQFVVGDRLPISQISTNQQVTLRKPDGKEIAWEIGKPFDQADLPGIYTLIGTPGPRRLAVNIAPEESRTTPLPLDQLEKLGIPLPKEISVVAQKGIEAQKKLMIATELENRQKLWRWLLVVGFLIVMVETWLAGRLTRPATLEPVRSSP